MVSPITDVSAALFNRLRSNQWTQVAYAFAATPFQRPGGRFDFGNNFGVGSQSVQIIPELDIRSGSRVAWRQQRPPTPERCSLWRPELLFPKRGTPLYGLFARLGIQLDSQRGYLPYYDDAYGSRRSDSSAAAPTVQVSPPPVPDPVISFGNISLTAFAC